MKKLFAVAFLAVMTLSANAQDFKKFRFGPTVGLNISTMNLDYNHSSKVGFNVGALAEYNFTDNIFMTGAVKFSQKGVKWNNLMRNGNDLKANPGYIEIPIHAGYRYSFNDNFSLFGEFGPYLAFGVCGKLKADGYDSIDYFGDDAKAVFGGKAKRFDFGLGFAVGAEYSKFQLRVGYDFGLTAAFDLPDYVGTSAKNRNLYFALSYMF